MIDSKNLRYDILEDIEYGKIERLMKALDLVVFDQEYLDELLERTSMYDEMNAVRRLLVIGAMPRGDVLRNIVNSGDIKLVREILERGVDVNSDEKKCIILCRVQ